MSCLVQKIDVRGANEARTVCAPPTDLAVKRSPLFIDPRTPPLESGSDLPIDINGYGNAF